MSAVLQLLNILFLFYFNFQMYAMLNVCISVMILILDNLVQGVLVNKFDTKSLTRMN